MNYYILRTESDPKILGVNDLDQAVIDKECFRDEREYEKIMTILGSPAYWTHEGDISDLDFCLCVKLRKRAKMTDFLQFTPMLIDCPFIVSKAVKSLLLTFNLYGVTFWPAEVVQGGERHDFFLVHFSDVGDGIIDFSRSSFYPGAAFRDKNLLKFTDKSEKDLFINKNHFLRFNQTFANGDFDRSLDLFQLSNAQIIISERLKVELEAAGFSAIRLLPAFGDEGKWLKFH